MIDRHYGHLAKDGRQHAIKLLDTHTADVHHVDAAWTPNTPSTAARINQYQRSAGTKTEPSVGLEPTTPSLPFLPGKKGACCRCFTSRVLVQDSVDRAVYAGACSTGVPRYLSP
jgi:hypothetical protein